MYSPCAECFNRYGRQYTEECDNICDYAHALSRLKPYGGLDEVIEVMKGDRFPLVFIDKDHIDQTYQIVASAKEGII